MAIRLGDRAHVDPVLAEASRIAAQIVLAMARVEPSDRLKTMWRALDALGPGISSEAVTRMRALIAQGRGRDQAVFDAMRLAIANHRMDRGLREIRHALTAIRIQRGADAYEAGLGDIAPSDRAAACTAASIGGTVGGALQVIPVFGTIVGGVLGIAGGIAGGALDCGREQREAAQRVAQTEAAAAAALLQQAQAAEAARQARTRQYLMIGGGAVLLGGIAYLVLS